MAGDGTPDVSPATQMILRTDLAPTAWRGADGLPEHASLAIVIADAPSREIRAIVSGGGSESGEGRGGFLDLTRAVRSPGSAMKPFIYAMAFADGIAGPETPLDDLPHRYGGYAPENFDRGFAGHVTAAEALRRSLNLFAERPIGRKLCDLAFAVSNAVACPLVIPWPTIAAAARTSGHRRATDDYSRARRPAGRDCAGSSRRSSRSARRCSAPRPGRG